MPVIGNLCPESPGPLASRLKAFHEGLDETGFVEGRDVAIDYQWTEGQYKRLPALAADLVARNVDVIVAVGGAPVVLAAKASTGSKTIVFEMGGDPVQLGGQLVAAGWLYHGGFELERGSVSEAA